MNQEKFYQALSQLADRDISPELFQELEDHLLASEEARNDYREFIHLQSLIGLEIDVHLRQEKVVPIERIISRQKRRALKVAVLSAAAILMIGLVTMRLFFVSEKEPTLVFETSPGTQFELAHSGANDDLEGAVLENGSRLTLSQGTVELSFASGVKSIVMAPADLTLHDDDTLFLNQGTAWFQVPKGAEGFTVKTKDLDIVDLGTEFGVLAKPGEHDELHVLKGKVEVIAKRLRMESATLVAGEARRIDPVGRLTKIPAKATAFMTGLPKTLPYLHWSFDDDERFQVSGTHPLAESITTTAASAPAAVPGKRGTALSLDGNAQFLSTDWEGFSGNRPRTVSFWLKLPEDGDYSQYPGIVGWGDRMTSKWKVLAVNSQKGASAKIRLSWGDVWLTSRSPLEPSKWHHVTVTTNGQINQDGYPEAELYFNGQKQQTSYGKQIDSPKDFEFGTSIGTLDSTPLLIGSDLFVRPEDRNFFNGEIDELYIFDGHMTEDEVWNIYNR